MNIRRTGEADGGRVIQKCIQVRNSAIQLKGVGAGAGHDHSARSNRRQRAAAGCCQSHRQVAGGRIDVNQVQTAEIHGCGDIFRHRHAGRNAAAVQRVVVNRVDVDVHGGRRHARQLIAGPRKDVGYQTIVGRKDQSSAGHAGSKNPFVRGKQQPPAAMLSQHHGGFAADGINRQHLIAHGKAGGIEVSNRSSRTE